MLHKLLMTNYKEDIYNKIIAYYDLSEKIKVEILKLEDVDSGVKFDVLMPIVNKIKETADVLMEKYVILLNKNKLYEIYNNK